MTTQEAIYRLICEQSGVEIGRLAPGIDLFKELGIDGDDFSELMEQYAQQFSVDMSTYLWYFHHGEEGGPSLGRLLFGTPDSRVERITVTPALLMLGAERRQWPFTYPVHQQPAIRWDMVTDRALLYLLGGIAALVLLRKWLYI